jgi:succinate dehydrogenase flavin-adding protein (antitoxin of CptAB toxin-antitoxin module)
MSNKLKNDIKQAKKRLIKKKICENFGQNELRKLSDKYSNIYGYSIQKELNEFFEWCMNYESGVLK